VRWTGAESSGRKWPLPSTHDERFMAEVDHWLAAVRDRVLAPARPPGGPLVAVQVGNEGVFSDAQHPIWANDYSEPALAAYRDFLVTRYGGDLGACARAHDVDYASWVDVQPPRVVGRIPASAVARFVDWSAWQATALGRVYSRWARVIALPVEFVAN